MRFLSGEKNKLILLILTGVLIFLFIHPRTVFATSDKDSGYWRLNETIITTDEDEIGEDGYASYYYSGTELTHTERVSRPKTNYHGAGSAVLSTSCSAPPQIIYPEDEVIFSLSASVSCEGDYLLWTIHGAVGYGEPNDERNGIMYNDPIRFSPTVKGEENRVYLDTIGNTPNPNAEVKATLGKGYEDGDEIAIMFNGGGTVTLWIYKWVDTSVKETVTEQATDDNKTEDEGSSDNDITTVTGDETDMTEDTEEEEETDDKVYQEDFTDASNTSGEDQGTAIIDEIFEGGDTSLPEAAAVGGLGALIAGGAAVSSGTSKNKKTKKNKKEKNKEEKKASGTYKMYVNKEFGDVLSINDQPKYVYARIVEVEDSGYEKERDDLTQRIKVFSGDNVLSISDAGMTTNGYKAALVSVPENCEKMRGQVSFTLSGTGGTYVRHVEFKIVLGDPEIVFTKIASDGVSWAVSSFHGEATLIAGLGGTDKVPFYIANLYEEPKELRTDADSSFKVTFEKVATYENGYYAVVENCSEKMEKSNDIVADQKDIIITIEAELNNGTVISNYFVIALYPDGITVIPNTKFFKNDILQVNTVPDEDPKPGDLELMPSSFDVLVCYRNGQTDENVIIKNPSMSFKDPDDEGRYGNTFKENFTYRIVHMGVGGFDFFPKSSLPMFGKPYEAKMRLIYRGKDGACFEGDLPIEFWGDKPVPPSQAEKEEAIKRLKKTVELFGIGPEPQIRQMIRNIEFYSPADIEFLRYYIILVSLHFYEDYSKAETGFADLCQRYEVVASSMVKAGDYAIQVILNTYYPGGTGKLAAAFINPFKNMLFEWIGMYYGLGAEPENGVENVEKMKTFLTAVQDTLGELISGDLRPTPEGMGIVVSCYLIYSYANHYYYGDKGEKGDVYRSVLCAVGDLGLNSLKAFISDQLTKNKKTLEETYNKLGKWIGGKLSTFFNGIIQKVMKYTGDKAFESQLRATIKDGIGYAEYAAATAAKNNVKGSTEEILKKILYDSDKMSAEAIGKAVDMPIAAIINYVWMQMLGNEEPLGATTDEALLELFFKAIGFVPENMVRVSENTIGLSSFRVENGTFIVGFCGYEVRFSVMQNISIIFDMIFTFAFGWMDQIFDASKPEINTLEDLRDRIMPDKQILDDTVDKINYAKEVEVRPTNVND